MPEKPRITTQKEAGSDAPDHLKINLEKRRLKPGLGYSLEAPASENHIEKTEKKLKVRFPEQVKMFYRRCNGLMIEEPHLEILGLQELEHIHQRIDFALMNHHPHHGQLLVKQDLEMD